MNFISVEKIMRIKELNNLFKVILGQTQDTNSLWKPEPICARCLW